MSEAASARAPPRAALARARTNSTRVWAPGGGRWRRGGDPRPCAHLKRSAAADWRARRGPGEGRGPGHWPLGAPVTVAAACRPAPALRGPKQPGVPGPAAVAGREPRPGVGSSAGNLGFLLSFLGVLSMTAGAGGPGSPWGPRDCPAPAPESRCSPLGSGHPESAGRLLPRLLVGTFLSTSPWGTPRCFQTSRSAQ